MSRPTVRQRPDGTWYARPYLGIDPANGRPVRPYRCFPQARSEAEAQAMADEWAEALSGAPTVSVAMGRYVGSLAGRGAPSTTVETYESALRCYVVPHLGPMAPRDVRASHVEGLYAMLLLKGARRKEGGVSPRTVLKVHWLLVGGFRWMARQGIVESSPMAGVDKPRVEPREAVALFEGSLARLDRALGEALRQPASSREAIARRNCMAGASLALGTGLRCGEVCALVRPDAQLWRRNLHVHSTAREPRGRGVALAPTTKGRRSRNVSLSEGDVGLLRGHYAWQASYLGRLGEQAEGVPVFCDADGGHIRPSVMSREFRALARRAGLPEGTTFHSLRHTHASVLLMEGLDLRAVQERLGHATAALTLGLYAHLMPGRDAAAAAAFESARRRLGEEGA